MKFKVNNYEYELRFIGPRVFNIKHLDSGDYGPSWPSDAELSKRLAVRVVGVAKGEAFNDYVFKVSE